ncbi:hypothetical protein PCL_10483 [Purpureocillium lilacinum]|uniref:Uncharacterized protein n=1 Tax=Purpureocillium lilacinum TaxID=33203 RepID=A0A2U3DQA8_PURLI|nr:hypothetical protein PCL_10483 [Purpureocillium lilacinum]
MAVFRAFCESFEQIAKQFTSALGRGFAEHFSNRFLDLWRQSPLTSGSHLRRRTAASSPDILPASGLGAMLPRHLQPRNNKDHSSQFPNNFAIRTHIAAKVGIELRQVPTAFKVNSGWAIRTTDATIRDLIVQRQSEWSEDLGATNVEISQRRYRYFVAMCAVILTDLHWPELDSEAAIRDEIVCQTGFTPVSVRHVIKIPDAPRTGILIVSFLEPTQKPWRPLGCMHGSTWTGVVAYTHKEYTHIRIYIFPGDRTRQQQNQTLA